MFSSPFPGALLIPSLNVFDKEGGEGGELGEKMQQVG